MHGTWVQSLVQEDALETQQEDTFCKSERKLSLGTKLADTLMDFSASRIMIYTFLLFKSPLNGILLWQPEQTNRDDLKNKKRISSIFFLCINELFCVSA